MNILVRILVFIIQLYRKFISPLLPNTCRYYPSCSAYSIEALETHGFFYGLYLSIKRVLRCHPLFPGGYDPVPPPRHQRKKKLF